MVVYHQTRFAYDGNQIVLQFDKDKHGNVTDANLSHRYFWGPAVDQLLADEQLTLRSSGEGQGNGNRHYDLTQPGDVVWPLSDNLGTVRDLAVYDAAADQTNVVNHRVYDAYGKLLSETNPQTNTPAAVDCLFAFTGKILDKNTGLQNNVNRWYDPTVGKWISEDPIGFKSGTTELQNSGDSIHNSDS
jgi:RHS repeat-associated protein